MDKSIGSKHAATIPFEDAERILDETLAEVAPRPESVPVRAALGGALLSDAASQLDLPPFDKSAMDGYAVPAGDEREQYRLIETVPAGRTPTRPLVPGTATKVMTGACVPAGTGQVIIVEHTEERGDTVFVRRHSSAGNICRQGEDVQRGDTVLKAGTVLTALDVANLVACGVTEVEVAERVRLAVISTGDEVVDSPELLRPGRIMNANGPLLAGLAEQFGLRVVSEVTVPDAEQATTDAVRAALDAAEVVVLSGGVSVGEFDFVTAALGRAGLDVHFTRVAVKPGKPMTYASGSGKAVFALPGNPVSVYLMFHLFVLRAAARMMGVEPPARLRTARMAAPLRRRKVERRGYVPSRLTPEGVEPIEYHGSAHLTALTDTDGFLILPVGVKELQAGDEVQFMPRARGWR